LDCVVRPDISVKPEAEDPAEKYETLDQEMTARAPHGTIICGLQAQGLGHRPIFVANILVLSLSNLLYGPGMERMLICYFLTISLAPTMWETWTVRQIPSSLAPSTTVKRSVSHVKLMSGFTLHNIQSSMY
jgi:hypothetical protein